IGGVQTVTKRELNQHTAAVLDQVTETNDVVVTERGTPRWRVSAVRDPDPALKRLERTGRYTPPAREPAPWPGRPSGPAYTGADVDALLDELRGGR
ncbi:MAG: type II toxin-antitoxin system Phd/YefM family antitoxin, partial [Dermatophilaceae bacterium]